MPEPAPVEGSYRCTECRHGKELWAWAGANVCGPLAANGRELAEHQIVDEWGIHTDSIECGKHPRAVLESFVGGRWCRWWRCPRCDGKPVRYGCPAETPFPPRHIGYSGQTSVHQGWLPAGEHEAATVKAAGAVAS